MIDDPRRLIVALDLPSAEAARAVVAKTGHLGTSYKIGFQLCLQAGTRFVAELAAQHRVFLDLKLHDIPNTVARAVEAITRLGVWMTTLHVAGGSDMMQAAREATTPDSPLLVAVTVMTSLDQATLQRLGMAGPLEERVCSWSSLAQAAGMDGVVCSPHEIAAVKAAAGAGFMTVTPGIRPAAGDLHDQSRVATAASAVAAGGDYLVVGRPITMAADPAAATAAILAEMGVGQ